MENKYLSVAALTKYLKYKFDSDEHLRKIFLKGEISNLKKHSTGHLYFSIKDESSKINAIMFSSQAKKIDFDPEEGTKILVSGRISIYESTGSYQIYVDEMQKDGVGNLYAEFEKLKKKLSMEGLFDEKHKKKIPKIPTKVGIVTAPTGAAIKDILSTIERRYPLCETYLFPSLVQGEYAKEDIVNKIKQAENYDLDVLIVGRGGGSIEDLWAFNEEIVARAIYECKIPVVSAVGHEVDFTIADFVADLRAPTPTGAAEMVVPNIVDLERLLSQFRIRLNESISKKLKLYKLRLNKSQNSYILKNPMILYENKKQQIDIDKEKLTDYIKHKLETNILKFQKLKEHYLLSNPSALYEKQKISLYNMIDKLEVINPLGVLKRGYNVTYNNSKLVKSVNDVNKTDEIDIRMHDGIIKAQVLDIKESLDG